MHTRSAPRWTIVFAGALMLLGVAPPVTASEARGPEIQYVDVGYDPDDRNYDETSCCQQDPDIRWTSRKLWVDGRDRTWLTIKFQAYETFIGYWSVIAWLDTRGGPGADYRMMVRDDGTRVRCWIRSRRSSAVRRGQVRQGLFSGLPATCRVPLQFVRRDKRIRWRLVSPAEVPGEGSEPSTDEYAPDNGWYV
ncbi:MAG: hypothetical protein WD834_00290 [Actinomycetota bacterium]